MCGIVGFNWKDIKLVKKMIERVAHRGPNDSGFYTSQDISIGHRRLSIIDLSKKGHQPMFNEDKSIAIVFNGEIWNYKDLRKNLEEKGHQFKSNSDTEVIIHGYEEYGEDISSMLDGMFAFALWDEKKKKILLSRDKIGKKPLYYYLKDGNFLFASEIKSILEYPIKREINYSCLSEYLSLRFSPDSLTMFRDIKKLPPGSFGIFKGKNFEIKKYYSIPKFKQKFKEDKSKAENLISKAIEKRMMSDVPIGVFLSGGLDSSTIVAFMSKFSKDIRTFSVGFNSQADETKYAKVIAKKFKTNHKEIRLSKDIIKYLPEVIYHYDEPIADPASLPTFLLCKEVSKNVKVAISGEGGDEVFGGYQTFNYIPLLKKFHKIPFGVRRYIINPISKFLSLFFNYPKKQVLELISEASKDNSIQNNFKRLFYFPFSNMEMAHILKKPIEKDAFDSFISNYKDLSVSAQEYYFNEWLPNDLLMKADKMSMASSLEVRTPFLDSSLIEYFSGLRYEAKYNRNLFRKVIASMLPKSILNKPKQGFTLPLSEWFSKKETINRILPFLTKLKRRGIFDNRVLDEILNNPLKFRNEHKMWVLLNFEIWYEIFIEKINYKDIKL